MWCYVSLHSEIVIEMLFNSRNVTLAEKTLLNTTFVNIRRQIHSHTEDFLSPLWVFGSEMYLGIASGRPRRIFVHT